MQQQKMQPISEESDSNQSVWPVAIFTVLYFLAAVVGALVKGNREFLVYIAVMLLLIGLVWKVHRTVVLSSGALWV